MYWTSAQLEQDTTMTWDWFNVCGGGKECCASSRWHGGIHHLSGKIRVPYPNHGISSMLMSIHEVRGACVRGWRSIASWGCDGRPSRRRWQLISGSQKVNKHLLSQLSDIQGRILIILFTIQNVYHHCYTYYILNRNMHYLVGSVDEDNFVEFKSGILADPVRIEDTKSTTSTTDTFLLNKKFNLISRAQENLGLTSAMAWRLRVGFKWLTPWPLGLP